MKWLAIKVLKISWLFFSFQKFVCSIFVCVTHFLGSPIFNYLILTQETNLAFVLHVQSADSTSALIVTFTFMRACIIALVVRASGIPSQPLPAKNDDSCDFIICCSQKSFIIPSRFLQVIFYGNYSKPSHKTNEWVLLEFTQNTSKFGHRYGRDFNLWRRDNGWCVCVREIEREQSLQPTTMERNEVGYFSACILFLIYLIVYFIFIVKRKKIF